MIPIKFRGKVPVSDKLYGGQVVFGSLVDYGEGGGYRFWINPIKGERNYPVEPESIAQLCGYDDDGKEIYEGDTVVFGSLVDYGEGGGYRFWINPIKGERNYPVEPESIAQLCGYDDDGKEIYEGDTVVDGNGNEYTVRLYAMGVNDEDCVSLYYDGKLCFKLKEEV